MLPVPPAELIQLLCMRFVGALRDVPAPAPAEGCDHRPSAPGLAILGERLDGASHLDIDPRERRPARPNPNSSYLANALPLLAISCTEPLHVADRRQAFGPGQNQHRAVETPAGIVVPV